MTKKTWTDVKDEFFILLIDKAREYEKDKQVMPILDEVWQKLFSMADTHSKCYSICHWLVYTTPITWTDESAWFEKFYQKMQDLSTGSFHHLYHIVNIANKKDDKKIFNDCLHQMIAFVEKERNINKFKIWRGLTIKLIPQDDQRWQDAKEGLEALKR